MKNHFSFKIPLLACVLSFWFAAGINAEEIIDTDPGQMNLQNAAIFWADSYSEGLAWAYYYKGDDDYALAMAVIDEEGNFVFTVRDYQLDSSYVYPYFEGYSYFRIYDNQYGYEVIVDRQGNEHFRTEKSEWHAPVQSHIIGRSEDGNFLLWVKEAGLESLSTNIRIITPEGEVLKEYPVDFTTCYGTTEMDHPIFGCRPIGEGWYLNDEYAFNFEKHISTAGTAGEFLEDFLDGAVMKGSRVGTEMAVRLYDADLNLLWEDENTYRIPGGESGRFVVRDGVYYTQKTHYTDDGVEYEHKYYDRMGNVVLEIEQYPGLFMWCTAFYDGLSVMELKGMDEKNYFTMIDLEGREQFKPIVYQEIYDFPVGGYVIADIGNGGYEVFNRSGEPVYKIYEALPDVKNLWFTSDGETSFLYCGYRVDKYDYMKILDLKKAEELGNSGYEIGRLTHIEEAVPEETHTENPAPEPEYQYITIDNFTIEGKWKSTGTYGFGQAQPGAIVVFDGIHCNFFSPQDTYAFYKEGTQYRLDTTSLMGGTESFTVKLLDENHIHVMQGSYITELERV